jgi:hypothetical protein
LRIFGGFAHIVVTLPIHPETFPGWQARRCRQELATAISPHAHLDPFGMGGHPECCDRPEQGKQRERELARCLASSICGASHQSLRSGFGVRAAAGTDDSAQPARAIIAIALQKAAASVAYKLRVITWRSGNMPGSFLAPDRNARGNGLSWPARQLSGARVQRNVLSFVATTKSS